MHYKSEKTNKIQFSKKVLHHATPWLPMLNYAWWILNGSPSRFLYTAPTPHGVSAQDGETQDE